MVSLLSFEASRIGDDTSQESPISPLRSLSNHQAAITDVVTGHVFGRNNIAVSASLDKTCIVWEYESGIALRTFLLQNQPLCLALDPVDRAAYAGYADGSIQFIDLYRPGELPPLSLEATPRDAPIQPPPAALWRSMDHPDSSILCLQVSYDGTQLLSGNQDGEVRSWNVATGENEKPLVDFAAPVTNLQMLTPTGFVHDAKPSMRLEMVTKPRYQGSTNTRNQIGSVPEDCFINAQFLTDLRKPRPRGKGLFSLRASDTKVPEEFMEAAVAMIMAEEEEKSRNKSSSDPTSIADLQAHGDFLQAQLDEKTEQLAAAVNALAEYDREENCRRKELEIKTGRKKDRRLTRIKAAAIARKKEMGDKIEEGVEEMDIQGREDEELSSSTDEMSDG